jgi:hypothetical protein
MEMKKNKTTRTPSRARRLVQKFSFGLFVIAVGVGLLLTMSYKDLEAADIPESCICSEETLLESPTGIKHSSIGVMYHCKCGKLDCVTHKVKPHSKLFCQEAGIFKSGGGNISPCQCSKALVKKNSAGEQKPSAGIMHHCKCGEITCATNHSGFNNPSPQLSCR